MHTTSNPTLEQMDDPSANSVLEGMQSDVQQLSRMVASFSKDAIDILANKRNETRSHSARISPLSKRLFVVVAILTLVLNLGTLFLGATNVQMVICNLGISVLFVLVSMCIVSDLSRGKSHFQDERQRLQERIHSVTEFLRNLLLERQQWVNEVCQTKWLYENEQLKLQMVKQDIDAQHEKLALTSSLVHEKSSQLDSLKREHHDNAAANETLIANNKQLSDELNSSTLELKRKVVERASLESENASLRAAAIVANGVLSGVQAEIRTSEVSSAALCVALRDLESELALLVDERNGLSEAKGLLSEERNRLSEEIVLLNDEKTGLNGEKECLIAEMSRLNDEKERLSEELVNANTLVGESESKQSQLHESIGLLSLEVEDKEQAVQAACEKSIELMTLYETLEKEMADLVESISVARGEHESILKQVEIANADREQLQVRMQQMQRENIELINEAVSLESRSAHQLEHLSSNEAALQAVEELLTAQRSQYEALQLESEQVDQRVANLLTQLGELECLAIAKSASASDLDERLAVEVDATSNGDAIENKADIPWAACLAHQAENEERQAENEKRLEIEALVAALDLREAAVRESLADSMKAAAEAEEAVADAEKSINDAEKAVADAEKRVEMLTEKADAISEQVQERSSELFGHKQELMEIRAEVRELEAARAKATLADKELADLESRIERQEAEFTDLQARMATLDLEYREKFETGNAMQQRLAELQSQLIATKDEVQACSQEIVNLSRTKSELQAAADLMKEQTANVQFDQQEAIGELQSLQNDIQVEQLELQKLAAEREKQVAEIDALIVNVELLRDQVISNEKELNELELRKESYQDLEQEIEKSLDVLERLRNEEIAITDDLEARKWAVTDNEQRMAELESELKKLEIQLANGLASESQAIEKLGELHQQQEETIANHHRLMLEIKDGEERVQSLARESQELAEQNKEANARLTSVVSEVEEAQSISKQWTSYIATLQSEIQTQEKQKEAFEQETQSLQVQAASKAAELRLAEDSLASLLNEQRGAQEECRSAELTLQNTHREIQEAALEYERIVDQKHKAEELLNSVEARVMEAEHILGNTIQQSEDEKKVIAECKNQRDALEAQIKSLEDELDRLTSEAEGLKDEAESLAAIHRSTQNTLKRVEAEVASLEAVKKDLLLIESKCMERQQEVSQLGHELADLQTQKRSVEADVEALETKKHNLQQLERDCDVQYAMLEKLQEEYEQKLQVLRELDTDIASSLYTKEDLSRLENDCIAKRAAIEKLEQDSEANAARLSAVHSELASKRHESAEMQSILMAKAKQLDELQSGIAARTLESDELTHHIEQSRREIGKLATRRKSIEVSIAELMQKVDELQDATATCDQSLQSAQHSRTLMEQQAQRVEAQLKSLQEKQEEATNQVMSTMTQLEVKNAEVQAIELKIAESLQTFRELNQNLQSMESSRSSVTSELDRKKIEIATATDEAAKMKAQCNQLRMEIEGSRAQLETLQAERLKLEQESNDLEQVNRKVAAAVSEAVPESQPDVVADAGVVANDSVASVELEENIWTSLNGLSQIVDSTRVDVVTLGSATSVAASYQATGLNSTPVKQAIKADPWASIFADTQ